MSKLKLKNIQQTVISTVTQPLKLGGIAEDASDAKIVIESNGNMTLNQVVGIKFPATQVPSADPNTLDDYEEGTFTPTVYGSISNGTATYTIRNGAYRKIGSVVFISVDVEWAGHTGTGNMIVGGSPFSTISAVSVTSYLADIAVGSGWSMNNIFVSNTFLIRAYNGTSFASVPISTIGRLTLNCVIFV